MKKQPKPLVRPEEGLTIKDTLIGFLDRIGWDGSEIVPALLDEYAHELAEKIWAYKWPEKPACHTTQHCAHHGWCHRCDPERSGMDRAARLIAPKGQL